MLMPKVSINRQTGEGRDSDVIDVADYLGTVSYGSAANAAAQMIRQSPLFRRTLDSDEFKAWRSSQVEADSSPEPANGRKSKS